MIGKISLMDKLPNFLRYGALLELASRAGRAPLLLQVTYLLLYGYSSTRALIGC